MKKKGVKTTCVDVIHHVGEDLQNLREGDMYALMRHHLDRCPNCEVYIDSIKKLIKLYRLYPDPQLGNKARKRLHGIIHLTH